MRKPIVIVIAVASFAAATVVGVAAGRVLRDDPQTAEATTAGATQLVDAGGTPLDVAAVETATDDARPTVADVVTPPVRLVPVAEPVAVGHDDALGELLLDPELPDGGAPGIGDGAGFLPTITGRATVVSDRPAAEPGTEDTPTDTAVPGTGEPVTTPDTAPENDGADDETGTSSDAAIDAEEALWYAFGAFDSSLWPLLWWFVDPCAGTEPGAPTPEGCPDGYGATFATRTPPLPFMFFARGHFTDPSGGYRTCPASTPAPADGQAAMTLFTRTPLAEVSIRHRRYGSADPWTEATIAGTPAATETWWMEQFESREYDEEWGTTPICFVVDRDPAFAYEIDGDAVDVFGQPVSANSRGVIPLDDPTERPPTTGQVAGLSSVATITARTVPGGDVVFRATPITGDPAAHDCSTIARVTAPVASSSQVVLPPGVYDPAFTDKRVTQVPIPPGGQLLVCAQIFPSDNPLRPLGTDRLLFTAPTQERPRIVLQGIRRTGFGTATIGPNELAATASLATEESHDGCAAGYVNREEIAANRPTSIEQVLWECVMAALPADGRGRVDVPVRVTRRAPSGSSTPGWHTEEIAVPIALQRCDDPGGCGRPREWYEVPIPTDDGRGVDGIAVIRVEYPVVASATADTMSTTGTVTLIDQLDERVLAETPRVRIDRTEARSDPDDPFHPTGRIRVFIDRPMRLTATATEEESGSPCLTEPVVAVHDELASEIELEFPRLCAGKLYLLAFTAVDADGNEFHFDERAGLWMPPVQRPMAVQVDLLGGPDVPTFGYIYRFGVSLDEQNPTAYWWDWTGPTGSTPACHALAGTTARSRGTVPAIILGPPRLDVSVRVDITTSGARDCGSSAGSGLGEITVNGSFSLEELAAGGPLVLETEPGATLPMRVTITMSGRWTLVTR